MATNRTSSTRNKDGQQYYDVEVDSPVRACDDDDGVCLPTSHPPTHPLSTQDVTYLSSITVAGGKVYAMFVKSPTKAFKNNEGKYRDIVQSFRLL